MLPLHREANAAQKSAGFHAGLWYDRFFDRYEDDCSVPKDEAGKLKWINTVTATRVGDKNKLEAHATRQQALLGAWGGQSLVMRNDWHFVTGMGNNHPVENGFAWHHTLGVPYLTGAAVKGMVRAWCEVWKEFDAEKISRWFGDTDRSGELIFFDAIPTGPVQLKADIMTPHYGKWYAEGASRPNQPDTVPADWHDPTPIPFLVVEKGASFQFAVAARAGSDIDLSQVTEALSDALQWLGAGAKTAAGYGRMQCDKGEQARITQQAENERRSMEQAREKKRIVLDAEKHAEALGMTGLALEMVRDAHAKNWVRDKGKLINEAGLWLGKIASEDSGNLAMAASWLAEQMDALFPGIMSNPDKVKGKKAKPVFKDAQRELAHRLIGIIGA